MKNLFSSRLAIMGMIITLNTTLFCTDRQPSAMNKQIVQEAFDNWARGTGSFFDLLSEDMQWTITGSTPLSKTYHGKKQFMDEVITPLNERLAIKIHPTVREIYANEDDVVVLWDGKAVAKDSRPYNMSYAWFLKMKDGKVVSVVAFLDGIAFTDIMIRIP